MFDIIDDIVNSRRNSSNVAQNQHQFRLKWGDLSNQRKKKSNKSPVDWWMQTSSQYRRSLSKGRERVLGASDVHRRPTAARWHRLVAIQRAGRRARRDGLLAVAAQQRSRYGAQRGGRCCKCTCQRCRTKLRVQLVPTVCTRRRRFESVCDTNVCCDRCRRVCPERRQTLRSDRGPTAPALARCRSPWWHRSALDLATARCRRRQRRSSSRSRRAKRIRAQCWRSTPFSSNWSRTVTLVWPLLMKQSPSRRSLRNYISLLRTMQAHVFKFHRQNERRRGFTQNLRIEELLNHWHHQSPRELVISHQLLIELTAARFQTYPHNCDWCSVWFDDTLSRHRESFVLRTRQALGKSNHKWRT